MTGPDGASELARVRAMRPGGTGNPTPDCLDDDTVAALAEGALGGVHRPAALAHVAECERCRRAVASVARALADPELATEIRVLEKGTPMRRFLPVALGVGTAAAVLLLLIPPSLEDFRSPHRASPITAAPAPQAVSPVGPVSRADQLRWTSVAGADRYRVTLFDIDGSVVYSTELTETSATLPPSLILEAGRTYAWRVEARLGFDRWAGSELIEFSVVPRPQQ